MIMETSMYYKISYNGDVVYKTEISQLSYNEVLKKFRSMRKRNVDDKIRLHGLFGEVLYVR